MMAQITFDKEFNYWDILVELDIQPNETEKYAYSELDEVATLIVHDVTQQQLDNALAAYDHDAFLARLPKEHPTLDVQIELLGMQLSIEKLTNMQLNQEKDLLIDSIGAELAHLRIELITMKGGGM